MITRILQHKQIKSIRLQVSRITRKPALIIPILFISFVLKKVLPLHTALSLISVIVLLVYKNQKKLQNSIRVLALRFHETSFGYYFNLNVTHLYGALFHGVGLTSFQVAYVSFGVVSTIYFFLGGLPSLIFAFVIGVKSIEVYKYYLFPLVGLQYYNINGPIYDLNFDKLVKLLKSDSSQLSKKDISLVLKMLFFRLEKKSFPLLKINSQRTAKLMRIGGIHHSMTNKVLIREFHSTSPAKSTVAEVFRLFLTQVENSGAVIRDNIPRVLLGAGVAGAAGLAAAGLQQSHNNQIEINNQRHRHNHELREDAMTLDDRYYSRALEIHDRIERQQRLEDPNNVYIGDLTDLLNSQRDRYESSREEIMSHMQEPPASTTAVEFITQYITFPSPDAGEPTVEDEIEVLSISDIITYGSFDSEGENESKSSDVPEGPSEAHSVYETSYLKDLFGYIFT